MKKPSILLRTFGCQMNVRDSEFVAGLLIDSGFRLAGSADKADVILFNSCSVRKHAEDRLFANIAELKKLKVRKPGLIIGLIGCTAQSYGAGALERAPLLDFACGPGNETDLPAIIEEVIENRLPVVATNKVDKKREELFPRYRQSAFKAQVSISEGCSNFCSYCIVPYVRGKERSRRSADIIREVRELAGRAFKEITLLGQNVNSFNDAGRGFMNLLEKLNDIKGIERIRFMTSHPKDVSQELFRAIASLDKVCEHLHLPLQSGSDRILKLMNRGYTLKKYLALVDSYRKIVPEGVVTTDIIVGFPTEKDKDFRQTLGVVKKTCFDSAFTFKYSPREPAKACRMKDYVPESDKDARLKAVNDLQQGISFKGNEPLKGKVAEVLVDAVSSRKAGELIGRTRTNKMAAFNGSKRLVGHIVDVRIDSAAPYLLRGRIA